MAPPDEPPHEPQGHLRPTSGAALSVAGIIGLGFGWGLRPVVVAATGTAPFVTWVQALALVFVGTFLAYVAWDTWQTVQVKRRRLPGNGGLNRLVLGRASALVGALVAGGYTGYGITWLGDASELANERLGLSALAAAGGLLVMVASLALERACRVPPDDPTP